MTENRDLVALVLAAGLGTRMRPFTDHVPKPLLTVNNQTLLEHALDLALRAVGGDASRVACNAHYLADQIEAAARAYVPGITVSVEQPVPLGTGGAVRNLTWWIEGRDVLIVNADAWLSDPVDHLLDGWDGTAPRLLSQDLGRPSDFGTRRVLAASLLPGRTAMNLDPAHTGLYATAWLPAWERGELQFADLTGVAFDCGTPAEFLAANQYAAGRDTIIAADAEVLGIVDGGVVLAGARGGRWRATAQRDSRPVREHRRSGRLSVP